MMLSELQKRDSKENTLIESINIISQENASLKLKLGKLQLKLEGKPKSDKMT